MSDDAAKVRVAAGRLRDNALFEDFLWCVYEFRERAVKASHNSELLIHPELYQRNAGIIQACDFIIDSAAS